jgi:hypothetical protein
MENSSFLMVSSAVKILGKLVAIENNHVVNPSEQEDGRSDAWSCQKEILGFPIRALRKT